MFEESKKLLEQNWTEDEKILIKRILDNIYSFRSLMPKALKNDISLILNLAIRIKKENEDLKIHQINLTQNNIQNNIIQNTNINNIQNTNINSNISHISNINHIKLNLNKELPPLPLYIELDNFYISQQLLNEIKNTKNILNTNLNTNLNTRII
jgi:hypothetical protein